MALLSRLLLLLSWFLLMAASVSRGVGAGKQAGEESLQRFEFGSLEMGTRFRVVLYAADQSSAREASEAAFQRIRLLDQMLSDYRPDSELNRLCREANHSPQVVSPELFHVLNRAQMLSAGTAGAFDVTAGPLARLWREARSRRRLPSQAEIAAARQRTGYRLLLLNPLTRSVRLSRDGMQLDLGGIAKGYAADEAIALLESLGFPHAMVEAGGDVRLGRAPPGAVGWRVGLAGSKVAVTIELSDNAVATSGDQFQFVDLAGRRYSHIVDPRTGMAMTDQRLVTIVAPDALTADSLATALSVMPPVDGMELIGRLPRVHARIEFLSSGKIEMSRGFPR